VLAGLRGWLAQRSKLLERRWIRDPFERARHAEIVNRRLGRRLAPLNPPKAS
jgi:hypothetical protein